MSKDSPIYWQDEILQVIYWMRGEGLGEVTSVKQLKKFLQAEERILQTNIQSLVGLGYLTYVSEGHDGLKRLLLTRQGIEEGRRRFVEEFESYLGQESHLVCDDPDCDCHDPEWQGVCTQLADRHPHS